MPNFQDFIKGLDLILQLIFGKNIPPWILPLTAKIIIIGLLIWGFSLLLTSLNKIRDNFKSLLYNPEQRRLHRRRQNFAKHIEYEIQKLDLLEDWKDDRFAELEAEVEAEGNRRVFSFIPFLNKTRDGLRREKSLSKALASSQAKYVLVEGDPGSGKSVALRHVALQMAAHAKNSKSLKSTIPIYINLKELERIPNENIDRNLIESFIKKILTRSNDRDVEAFLDEQFSNGIENGTWFFLFDSFDEIPEILSSTEADTIIKNYGNAIADFLQGGMNICRGVIASRQFRGPKQFTWPHFHILTLTEDRRLELIHKADLEHKLQLAFIGQLATAPQEIRIMASNPLFLSLLCEHVKSGHQFPASTYTVFETYIKSRLKRDEMRIQKRFKLNITQIRAFAEKAGFCMAIDAGLGLSPTREALYISMTKLDTEKREDFNTLLDALEYTKLARPDIGTDVSQQRQFTFAHRRFQEYFATCIVLRNPTQVSPTQLLTNARWRETAVVMCQTQPIDKLTLILEEIERLLEQFCNNIPNLINDPTHFLENVHGIITNNQTSQKFPWPKGSLHLLSLLQEAFSSHPEDLSNTVRTSISKLLLSATITGGPDDKKWALEVAGTAPESIFSYLLRNAFLSKSQWLREVAYRQASRIKTIPPDIAKGIHYAITELEISSRLYKEKQATRAHLSRLYESKKFLSTFKLLLNIPLVDSLYNFIFLILFVNFPQPSNLVRETAVLTVSLLFIEFIFWKLISKNTIYRPNSIKGRQFEFILYKIFLIMIILLISISLNSPIKNPTTYYGFAFFLRILLILVIILIYMSIPSIAFLASSTGLLNYWILWVTVPFYPIIWLLLYIYIEYSSILKNLYKMITGNKRIVLICVITLLIIPMSIVLAYNYLSYFSNHYFLEIIGICSLLMVFSGVLTSKEYLHDLRKWHNWSKLNKKQMTQFGFWRITNSYHSNTYRINFIKIVREQRLLLATKEAENFLRNIIWEAEKNLTGSNTTKLKEGIAFTTKKHRTLSWINYTALDELYKLLEDTRILNEDVYLLTTD